ncbi:hypothetical protein RIF29_29417 [Crotalaria pallida]|uniref:Uncharacterized protein n=1 Tax=Crotalaria pallida TaxID=3830 RepID=A0AAN9EEZ4_CROPI
MNNRAHIRNRKFLRVSLGLTLLLHPAATMDRALNAQSRSHKGTRPSPLSHSKFRTHFSVLSLSSDLTLLLPPSGLHSFPNSLLRLSLSSDLLSGSQSCSRAASLWQYRRRPSPFSLVTYRLSLVLSKLCKQPIIVYIPEHEVTSYFHLDPK